MNQERIARRAAVLVTDLSTGRQRLVKGEQLAADPLADVLADRLRMGKSGTVEHGGSSFFLTVQEPPVRLVIIGAVHVSQALSAMARIAGIDVTIVDPRTAFATLDRFPDTKVLAQWPDDALPLIRLDRFTAMAALTHDPKIDDPALIAALRDQCFYIGALGSRKTHAARRARLTAHGFSDEDLSRIHAPIGLDIGAVSPAEIAVSILGEVIADLRRKPTRAEKDQIGQAA
jgi:xanthine dehydrogenase accessory factor